MDRYEEAMNRMLQWEKEHPDGYDIDAMKSFVFPELKEGEDERIRKMLVEQMKNWRRMAAENCVSEDIKDANAALDWLENHTYPNHLIEDFLLYVLSYGKGGWGEEKQKEENDKRLERVEQLCKRIQELDAKIESLRRKIYGDEQKDSRQKMVLENPLTGEKVYEREIPECMMGCDPKDVEAIVHLAAKGWTVIAPVKEQKPAEDKDAIEPTLKQDYSGLTDFERAIHRGFLCAGVENVPVGIIKDTAQDCLTLIEQKPAEWSEEDEKILDELLDHCNTENAEWYYFLKSLRPQPHWKPSDEQMHYLLAVIIEPNNAGSESCHLALKGIYEQLKKLM